MEKNKTESFKISGFGALKNKISFIAPDFDASVDDFAEYMESSQHTNFFKPKTRRLGSLAKKGSVEFVGDWEVTPEELFDNDENESYSLSNKYK